MFCSFHIGSGTDACIHAIAFASYDLIQDVHGSAHSVSPLMSRSPLPLYPPCILPSFPPQLPACYSSCLANPSLVKSYTRDPLSRSLLSGPIGSLSSIIFRINRMWVLPLVSLSPSLFVYLFLSEVPRLILI